MGESYPIWKCMLKWSDIHRLYKMFTSSATLPTVSSFTIYTSSWNRSSAIRASPITRSALRESIRTGPTAWGRSDHPAWTSLCPSGTAGLGTRTPRAPRTHSAICYSAPSTSAPSPPLYLVHHHDKGEEQKRPKQFLLHFLKLIVKLVEQEENQNAFWP